jgi:hypothetical protein
MAAIINVHMAVKVSRLMPIVPGIASMSAIRAQAIVAAHAATDAARRAIVVRENGWGATAVPVPRSRFTPCRP